MHQHLDATPPDARFSAQVGQLILSNDLDQAERLCHQYISAKGPNAYVEHFQGLIALVRRGYDRAIEHFLRSMEALPNNAKFLSNLGEAYRQNGEYHLALATFEKSLTTDSDNPNAHLGIGNCLSDLNRYDDAETRFQTLLRIHPEYPQGYHYYAVLLAKLDQHKDAIRLLGQALSLDPHYNEAKATMAGSLERLGQTEEATHIYQELVNDNPGDLLFHNRYGNFLRTSGRIEEAESQYLRAIESDPHDVSAYYNRSPESIARQLTPEVAQYFEHVLENQQEAHPDPSQLHFVLARHYQAKEEYSRAFQHFVDGNEYDRRRRPYDPDTSERQFDILMRHFTPEFLAARKGVGPESPLPVFIVGMPRSGTTLTEQIIATHSAAFGAGELTFLPQTVQGLTERVGYPDGLHTLAPAEFRALGERYLGRIRDLLPAGLPPVWRITDKLPGNLVELGLITIILPGAKVIHCRRNAIDTCFSCFTQRFTTGIPYSNRLEDLGRYYTLYERLMSHWHAVLPDTILDVQYEDLVADPEAVSRRMIDFVGLEWEETCLRFYETVRPIRTASVEQVRQPIYGTAIGKWRKYEGFLGPLVEALGPYGAEWAATTTTSPKP